MKCGHCGSELSPNGACAACGEPEANVTVLSPEESQHFSGMTIEQGGADSERAYEETQHTYGGQRIYVKQVSLSGAGFFTKLLWGVVLAGIAIFAFSSLGIILLAGMIVWFVLRLFR